MRNLTKTLAVVSLLAPASGYTLGIGDIKLQSALNQNLDAEISLVLSAGETASDIKVNLASLDKFDEAGVPWATFLSKIKFTKVVGANGSVLIKLRSYEAVKEPFLDFLLEVSWPKGNLYREFTVLVDPPEVYKKVTIPVVASSESYEPEQDATLQRQTLQRQQAETENSTGGASEYGPTGRNDMLWKIAERTNRQEDISVEQMTVALYEANPLAFYQDNMNALLSGKTLKIPDREVILKFSRKQALAEIKQQTKDWKNRLSQTPIAMASAKKEATNNQLTQVAPIVAPGSESVEGAPENEQVTLNNTAVDELPAPSEIADQEAVAASPVDDALQDKVAELEKQLAMMQQTITLKDLQLAALQNLPQAKPVIQAQAIQAAPGQAGIAAPVVSQNPAQPIVKPPVQQESEAGDFSDPYFLWIGGIGTGTLSLFAWLWQRNRKIGKETNSQPPFVASTISNMYEAKEIISPSLNKNSAACEIDKAADMSSFLSEMIFADIDAFDTDQTDFDPVSEADVYMAYGRYQQAEELMRVTLKAQPDRNECKLKLLEIFYSRENSQAFEAYASELAETGKKDDVEFWAKVTIMGSQICPDSRLFSSEEDHNEVSEAADNLLNFDLASFEDGVLDDTWKNNESINFDLSAIPVKEKGNGNIDLSVANDIDEGYQSIEFSTDKSSGLNDSISDDLLEGDLDFEFDFDMPLAGSYGQDSDLVGMDELETKLDLAMAYIDMNDSDAAKDIATEVLEKGSPEQQMTAQVLLDSLK
ncbi:MAG: hypothetical protein PHD43_03855 [Methylococcales bacterium]|nr:hypothetical protein [Methylococcales bacterium]